MDDQVLMGVPDGSADLQKQTENLLHRAARGVGSDLDAVDELHGQKLGAVAGSSAIEEARDSGMFQPRQNLPLPGKQCLPAKAGDGLQGHLFVEGAVVAGGEVDGAHTALAQFADDPVGPDARSGPDAAEAGGQRRREPQQPGCLREVLE